MSQARTSLEQWAVLSAVIDKGGFAQAAASLHRSQSAVSYAIARLQEALDVPLLSIEGRKAVLTPHGQVLLKRARPLLRDLETLESLARQLKQGWEPELRIVVDAAFPRERLMRIIAELQGLCPDTQMQLSDAILSGAEEAITDKRADVVVTTRVPAGSLGQWLIDVTFVAVARFDHPLQRLERALTAEDLARHVQAVVRDSGTHSPRDEGWLGAEHRCTVSSVEASLAIVEAGLAFRMAAPTRHRLARWESACAPACARCDAQHAALPGPGKAGVGRAGRARSGGVFSAARRAGAPADLTGTQLWRDVAIHTRVIAAISASDIVAPLLLPRHCLARVSYRHRPRRSNT